MKMKSKNTILTILLIAGFLPVGCSGTDSGSGDGLPAPSRVTVEDTTSTSITLRWTTVSGAAYYMIYTAVTSTGVYRYVDEAEDRRYVVNGLVPDTTYYYKVSAVDINGMEGPQSMYVEGTTKEQTIPVPLVNASALSANSIQVNWNSVTGATTYKVYRSASAAGYYELISTGTGTTYIDNGLSPLTTYYYRVSAVTSRGEGEQSATANARTPAEGVVPAPGNVQAAPLSATSIQISWNAIPVATSYKIYRSSSAAGSYTLLNTGAALTYTDTGLSPSTTYYYRVSAVHSMGESEQSFPTSATTPAAPPVVYKIGDTGPAGGLIFYDKGNNSGGWRYLEAAPTDIGNKLYATTEAVSIQTDRAVGTGKSNTQAIMVQANNRGGGFGWAAQACDALVVNGFDDWFLPSRDELNFMYGNLHMKNLGGFSLDLYWSSTFDSAAGNWTNCYYWWAENFSDGNQAAYAGNRDAASNYYGGGQQLRVRACRQF